MTFASKQALTKIGLLIIPIKPQLLARGIVIFFFEVLHLQRHLAPVRAELDIGFLDRAAGR